MFQTSRLHSSRKEAKERNGKTTLLFMTYWPELCPMSSPFYKRDLKFGGVYFRVSVVGDRDQISQLTGSIRWKFHTTLEFFSLSLSTMFYFQTMLENFFTKKRRSSEMILNDYSLC